MKRSMAKLLTNVLAAISLLCACTAWAEFKSGNDLIEGMQQYEKADRSDPGVAWEKAYDFRAYVIGVYDATYEQYVTPSEFTVRQLCAVVVRYLKANPEQWGQPAALLVRKALWSAFPRK